MRAWRAAGFAVTVAVAAAAGAALSADPDLRVVAGQPGQGEIVYEGEEDRIAVDLVRGQKLTVTAKPAKKSLLRCGADVLDPSEQVLAIDPKLRKESKGAVTLRNVAAAATGTYFVAVRGTAAGQLGLYDLTTKATAVPKPAKVASTVLAGSTAEFTFDALAGMKAAITVTVKKGSPLRPHVEAVLAPGGAEVDLGVAPIKRRETAVLSSVSKVPLATFGTWTVRVSGVVGSGGPFTATVILTPVKAPRTKADLRGGSGGAGGEPESLEILPGDVAVAAGGAQQLLARGTYAGGRTRDLTRSVEWGTANRNAATTSAASPGLVTGVLAGGTTVRAWTGAVEARERLVLVGGATVASVDVVPQAPVLAAGDAARLHASATLTGADPLAALVDVTRAADWQETGTGLSSADGGRAVAAAQGSSDVTATAGGIASAARTVNVTAPRVVRLALSPAYVELTGGSPSAAFTATATFSDGSTAVVTGSCTFASDNLAAATMAGATATRSGDGTAGIRAVLDGVASRPSVVNSGPVALNSISVTGDASIALGATAEYAATGVFAGSGGTRDVTECCTWMSSVPADVQVATSAGRRGAATALQDGAGGVNLSASLSAAGALRTGLLGVQTGAAQTVSLRVVPGHVTIAAGGAAPLRALATATDGAVTDVTGTAVWTTSAGSRATVAGGVVTGVADGGASISATLGSHAARATALVGGATIAGTSLDGIGTSAVVGESAAAAPQARVARPGGGEDLVPLDGVETLWLDDPLDVQPGVAMLTARRTGVADAVAVFGGTASPAATFTCDAPVARSLAIFPQTGYPVLAGPDFQFAAQLRRSDGLVTDAAATATWSSDDPSHISIGATGLAHAESSGSTTIRASHAPVAGQATATASTLGDPPAVVSCAPGTVNPGQTGVTFTLQGSALDGLSAQVSLSGSGITITSGPSPNAGGTEATFTADIAANAPTGTRDVTYTTLTGNSTLVAAFRVILPAPTIASVDPTNAPIPSGPTLTVTGTGFATGDTFTVESHSGVSLGTVTVVNPTTMTAPLTVGGGASITRLDVTVQQSAANGGASASLTDALKIGPPDPVITMVSPDHFLPGTPATNVRVTGTGFQSGIAITIPGSGSAGFTASSITRVSSTEITFTIAVNQTAAPSVQAITLQNPGDVANGYPTAFAITPRDPVLNSVSVPSVARGASNVDVTLRGTGFRSGAQVTVSGGGLAFSNVTVVSSETITAKLACDSGAALGARNVTVAHASSEGGRGSTRTGALTVVSGSPAVSSINPSKIGRTGSGGATRRVPLVVTGTNFSGGAAVSVSLTAGSGLTVVSGSTTVLSSTQIAFSLDVAGTATAGNWDVRVTNPSSTGDSGSSGNGLLQVVSESTLAVNRVIADSGSAAGGERVTVQGSGFVRGCRVEFATERARNVQFIDQNTLTCTVPPPANPASAGATTQSTTAATAVDVKVTNNPTGSATNATRTGAYSYAADEGPFQIVQSYPADSSTGNPQNLKSAVVRLSEPANTHTAVFGTTTGTHCLWFEGGGFFVTGQTGGFGADRRFLVFSRSGGGNLPVNNAGDYILETPTALRASSGLALTPAQLAASGVRDQWTFTISTSVTDSAAPTLSSRFPAVSATGVATTIAVTATFSEAVDPLTVTGTNVQLQQGGSPLSAAIALSDDLRTVTITPHEELAKNTAYTVSLAASVADLCGNTLGATSWGFTTQTSDGTVPTIDAVVLADLPSSVDGSGTYIAGNDSDASAGSSTAFDAYLPRSGWSVAVRFSDTGDGVDPATFSARANVAVGSVGASSELASKFTVTGTGATWTVGASDAFAAGDDATLTFLVSDKAGNAASASVVTFDVVDIDSTVAAAAGGDHDPFDTLDTWLLRFDRDVYTCTFSTAGSTQQVTTATGADGVLDVQQALRLCGLWTPNMTAAAAATVNGSDVGTNAIVLRLFQERVRATLRARFGIAEDGTRGADSANVDFLLPGEQGQLASIPVGSSSASGNSANAFSEMEYGGDTQTNSSQTGSFGTIGFAFSDPRNRRREANLNAGSSSFSNNNGVFCLNVFKSVANVSTTGTTWGATVLAKLVAAKGGTPAGESADDDDVLAGTFDRASGSNTSAQNTRYDVLMDAIEMAALSVTGVGAHEMGHSVGLVANGPPKTGLFGFARRENAFTEATASFPNTSSHLDFLGNDIMAPSSSVDERTATGSDFQRFNPLDLNYLLHRQVHDEGK